MLNLKKSIKWTGHLILLFFISLTHNLKAQNYPVSDFDPNLQQVIAFPGAEGFGKYTSGGRGGQVMKVTNLNDSGPGSLREAIEASGPRIVIFEVSGNIKLQRNLTIQNGDITIAGQTAPGDGITLQNYSLIALNTDNVIIRYLRSRVGDLHKVEEDSFVIRVSSNLMIDHCSFSWGTDETFSIGNGKNLTIQNSIIAEGLNQSIHSKGAHGFGTLISGDNISLFKNLWAHFTLRNPAFAGNGENGIFDFRNNVVYNWEFRSSDGGSNSKINFFYNYYKPGPASFASSDWSPKYFFNATSSSNDPSTYAKLYLEGNKIIGRSSVSSNQWDGVRLENTDLTNKYLERLKNKDSNNNLVSFPTPNGLYSNTRSADQAYQFVMDFSGSSLFRDAVDQRLINEVRNGTTTFKGSKTGLLGIIDSQKDVGGWPTLKTLPAPKDSDGDGIPDAWELANELNPAVPNDKEYNLSPYYSDIEVYINSLVAPMLFAQNPGVPDQVKTLLPNQNATVSPKDISFAWQPLINAIDYRIQISKSADFSSNVITLNNVKNYSLVYSQLDANSTYYWRVRGRNNTGNGAYSTVQSFKTNSTNSTPAKTLLLDPKNQETGISLIPILKWANVPNADSYQIQISTASDFSSFVINQSNHLTNTFKAPKLLENRTYYWRVRARNASGTGSYSDPGTFKTLSLSNSPEPVIPIGPINQVQIFPLNIQLKWLANSSAETYQVQVAKDYNFSNLVFTNSQVKGEQLKFPNLDSNTTYYWRIRGINRSGSGNFSSINIFKTLPYPTSPGPVIGLKPENGANIFGSKITFEWKEEPIAQTYRFQLSTSANFNSFVSNVGNLQNTSYTVSNLSANTQYYWRVIATNEAGSAPASEIFKVNTSSYSGTPLATTLIAPANQAVVGAETILFEWENQPQTAFYRLEISEQSNFSSLVFVNPSIQGTSLKVKELEPNKTYYWRIRTSNPAGNGERSDIWNLKTVYQDIDLYPPILSSPQKARNFSNGTISFAWQTVENAAGYHLQVSESADFTTVSFQDQNINTTNFSLNSLQSDKAYFWRVRARFNTLFSAWSDTWNFSIGSSDILLNSGLVGHWTMDDGGGNKMMDISGFNHHATIKNTSNISWVSGKIEKAIRLNGFGDRFGVVGHSSNLNIPNAITLTAWVKPSELQRGHVFYKSNGNGFELGLNNNGQIEFILNKGRENSKYRLLSNFTYNNSLNKWIHIAATFDGSTTKIFVNGKEDVIANYAPFSIGTSSGDLVLGAMGSIQRWRGDLDDLRLYDRALTANEILLLNGEEPIPLLISEKGNLMGHWKMDEGGGNQMKDHSGKMHHANILNTKNISWEEGKVGLAISLNGFGERYGLAPHHPDLSPNQQITLMAWIKPQVVGRNHIFYKSAGNGYELWLDNDGKVEFRLNRSNNGIKYLLKSNFDYTNWIGKWFHVTASFDGNTSKIFINGKEDASASFGPVNFGTSSGELHIGAFGTIHRWRGEMDELRIYNLAISEEEIQRLMGGSNDDFISSPVPDDLIGFWKMEEGSGSRLLDETTYQNHATLQELANVNWVEGKSGLAIDLNGWGGRFGLVPHNPSLEFGDQISISAWVKPNTVGRNTILSKGNDNGFELWLDNTGIIEFRLNRTNNGTRYRIRSNYNYTKAVNTWIHVAATYDGNLARIYVNGEEDINQSFGKVNFGTKGGDLVIGAMGTIQRFNGSMDEIQLYQRALTANEVKDLFQPRTAFRENSPNTKNIGATMESEESAVAESKEGEEISSQETYSRPKIYPNPTDADLYIESLWIEEGFLELGIYDIKGGQVLEGKIDVQNHRTYLDLRNIKIVSGQYILILQDNFHREILKFIKN